MESFNKLSALEKSAVQNFTNLVASTEWCEVPFPGWRSMRRHQQAPRLNMLLMASTKVKLLCSRQVKVVHFNRECQMLTILKEARDRQQVLSSQDPLTPWHLHSTFMFLSSSWKNRKINRLSLFWFPVKRSNLETIYCIYGEMAFSDNGINFSFSLSLKQKCLMLDRNCQNIVISFGNFWYEEFLAICFNHIKLPFISIKSLINPTTFIPQFLTEVSAAELKG